MNVEVYFTADSASEDDLRGKTVVAIDVLRASSTIVTALAHGAKAVIPVSDMVQAGRLAANMDEDTGLLGGERGGKRIDGFQVGNSPFEYTPEAVADRTVVLTTTNGTQAIARAKHAAAVTIGTFVNAQRVIDFLRAADAAGDAEIVLFCAGWQGRIALEDTLFAGYVLHRLWNGALPADATDACRIAHAQYRADHDRLTDALAESEHARRLLALDHADDVAYCSQMDTVPVLPLYHDGRLILDGEDKVIAEQALAERATANAGE
ncbi:MAG: 2-phosphosulfolactate phosphatase [Bacteroidota bacterium]